MKYPAKLAYAPDTGGYNISFRDIPEAITCADNRNDAELMAYDALITALDFYFEDNRDIPAPSVAEEDEILIELPISIEVKIMLLNRMLEARISQAELARKMDIKPQQVSRLVDLHHTTKIDTLVEALNTLGKKITLKIS